MAVTNALTTLARARSWVGAVTTNDDALLGSLISQVSGFLLRYMQRPNLFQYLYSDVYDGGDHREQMLRHWPVQSVSMVMVNGISIPAASNDTASGYVADSWDGLPPGRPGRVALRGYRFARGLNNVRVIYTAGFTVTGEAHLVPGGASPSIAPLMPQGMFAVDQGVTYLNGTAMMNTGTAPLLGQYSVSADGVYGFSGSDAGATILLSYSYVPADIEQACLEILGERYRARGHIGEVVKTLGGQETVSFSQKNMPDYVKLLLAPYRRVVAV